MKRGTLYIGVTSNLIKRVWQHKNKTMEGFTERYLLDKIVYYEEFGEMIDAIAREKQLKAGNRNRKIELIEKSNPNWSDLYDKLLGI